MKSSIMRTVARLSMVAFAMVALSTSASAQLFNQPVAGVEINPEGVLQVRQVNERIGIERLEAARRQLDSDLAKASKLRKVSLNRLEAAIAERQSRGESLSEAMKNMAGLTSVDYVFFYPETGDVVIAGPAEGFFEDPSGRVRGLETGLPTILLEDVVTALRAYPPHSRGKSVISVSIDPTEEGLRRLNKALSQVGNVRRGAEARLTSFLKDNLGLQTVTIKGVPASTHFAQVMVEADYRMKLIGIGLELLPNGMPGYTARTLNQRWFGCSHGALVLRAQLRLCHG